MNFFRTVFSSALFLVGFCSAALAVPVTFTYTSNPLDFSVFETHYEDWELAFLEEGVRTYGFFRLLGTGYFPPLVATVTVEVDCEIQTGSVICGSVSKPQYVAMSHYVVGNTAGPVTFLNMTGFTESFVWLTGFAVSETGEVTGWGVRGVEWGMVGDFSLDGVDDIWAFGFYEGLPEFYCRYHFGSFDYDPQIYDPRTGLCKNGEAAVTTLSTTRLHLGAGTWTSDLDLVAASPVMPTPLPAGLPLALSGLGCFAFLRRGHPLRPPVRSGADRPDIG